MNWGVWSIIVEHTMRGQRGTAVCFALQHAPPRHGSNTGKSAGKCIMPELHFARQLRRCPAYRGFIAAWDPCDTFGDPREVRKKAIDPDKQMIAAFGDDSVLRMTLARLTAYRPSQMRYLNSLPAVSLQRCLKESRIGHSFQLENSDLIG
jgi:hypothetical protein